MNECVCVCVCVYVCVCVCVCVCLCVSVWQGEVRGWDFGRRQINDPLQKNTFKKPTLIGVKNATLCCFP